MASPSTSPPLTRASVQAAAARIEGLVHRTPVVTSRTLNELASTPRASSGDGDGADGGGARPARPVLRLWFKCENLQRVGAFKVRGAFHALERLKEEPGWEAGGGRERGVVTHSSGNHAQALALAARTNGIPAHIVMPKISAAPKVAATRGYGAHIVFSGSTSVEREAVTEKVMEETGARLVPPYDHPDIVLGQGTLGLEFQEQVAAQIAEKEAAAQKGGDASRSSGGGGGGGGGGGSRSSHPPHRPKKGLDAIMTPCGGGGMLSGVALSAEGTGIRVFGAEPSFEGADDARRGFRAGKRVEAVSSHTIADGLRTPLGAVPWSVIYERRLVADLFAASEDEIRAATRVIFERLKLVVEPSAAVPLAVALYNEEFRALVEREAGEAGWDLGLVLSGGNVDLDALGTLFAS